MAKETVDARSQIKDENDQVVLDAEGKPTYSAVSIEYDFGDDLDAAVELAGADVVFSNYKANAKVGLQSIMRAKMKAGMDADAIQAFADTWKPGMVAERTPVDPTVAVANAWENWSDEKKAEFLQKLGISG